MSDSCIICYEEATFELPCEHFICKGCLDDVVLNEKKYKCNFCGKEVFKFLKTIYEENEDEDE